MKARSVLQAGAASFKQALNDSIREGNLANDAHLVALALEHWAQVVTYDRDMERFAGVRVERPSR